MTDAEATNPQKHSATDAMPPIVPGRECGACMQCCKLPAIQPLNKPSGKWCVNASPGRGCATYAIRPGVCRSFFCDWMLNPSLGPEWKPDKAKFMITSQPNGAVAILVDPAAPAAWRDPKYYVAIKKFAALMIEQGRVLTVHAGRRLTVVLPDRDHDAGLVPDEHIVGVRTSIVNGRPSYEVIVQIPSQD